MVFPIDFGHIFMHFYAFITGMDSFERSEHGKPPTHAADVNDDQRRGV